MSANRKLQRRQLKEEWKTFKKENRQYKAMPFSQFNKLWKESMLEKEAAAVIPEYSEEQDAEFADMLVEEIVEDEDPITE